MRVFISSDIEGVAGVVSREETGTAGFDWGRARERMTREVLAAMEGARAAGADGFVVADSHGTGLNLIPEMMPPDAELVRGWPRPLLMMEGIERGEFACAFLLGYHAGAGWGAGGLAHSFSSRLFSSFRVNGRELPEAGLSAAIAGQFGAPTTLVSGDDACIEEVLALLGPVETVTAKRSLGLFSAQVRSPAAIEAELGEAAARAVKRAGEIAPWRLDGPLSVDLELKAAVMAETLAYLPLFERTGPYSIRFEAADAGQVARYLQFFIQTLPALA
ncbi:MAG: M55 family metallopeptidase [Caulobacteraceae bacterium]|nr:M55 family metallopeptidase [Caulobacteraceae bacterium]